MTLTTPSSTDPWASLRLPEFRYWLTATALSTLAGRALAVALGYQVYELTGDPFALGLLGLVEAIPAVGLSLLGGVVADRVERRAIVLSMRAVAVLAALALTWIAVTPSVDHLGALYAAVFVAGLARGFADPAASAFEAQVVPRELYVNASTWSGSVWQATSILGPALGGVIYAGWGAAAAYGWVAGLLTLSGLSMALIRPKPLPVASHTESIWSSIAAGVRYVWHHQVLLGSMALDLFAVLFGGAVALLPIFASDILRVGPSGLGLLAAAPAVGALASMLWTARRPPVRHAGRLLLTAVAGFGLAMLVFAWSRVFWLSLAALAVSGLCDGLSVVIRETILRLHSPEALRGRIAAVSWIFIGSSNEIGAFESGLAAGWLGPVPAVWLGGLVTLLVVAVTAVAAPELRALHLDPDAPAPAAGPAPEPG